MASRGWENVTPSQVKLRVTEQTVKPSKYKNVKTTVDGQVFDSKREADYWIGLKAREHAGEIRDLQRQVVFPLSCLVFDGANTPNGLSVVARYIADFVYVDRAGIPHAVDAKGVKTAIYRLKKKWMALEHGIEIEEV